MLLHIPLCAISIGKIAGIEKRYIKEEIITEREDIPDGCLDYCLQNKKLLTLVRNAPLMSHGELCPLIEIDFEDGSNITIRRFYSIDDDQIGDEDPEDDLAVELAHLMATDIVALVEVIESRRRQNNGESCESCVLTHPDFVQRLAIATLNGSRVSGFSKDAIS